MNHTSEHKYSNFVWIDIEEPSKEQLEALASEHHLDYFLISDSIQHGHLPKFERLAEYDFIILRAYTGHPHDRNSTIGELSNKIAFFYNQNKLITVHRSDFKFLDHIPHDFESSLLLLIYIINQMAESYNMPSEYYSNRMDEVEKILFLNDYKKISLEDLYFQKSQTRVIKKLLQITQDVVNKIIVHNGSVTALQDVKDKILSLILIYDEAVEDANNLMNTYLSLTARKNNDVMKLLTIFSAFFLPLTFIVGLYGMNFRYMPELDWKLGYLWVILIMLLISAIIYFWFRRKRIL